MSLITNKSIYCPLNTDKLALKHAMITKRWISQAEKRYYENILDRRKRARELLGERQKKNNQPKQEKK